MPELPEVETVKRSLKPVVLNKRLVAVEIQTERILQQISPREFSSALVGNQFLQLCRRGKYLLFSLENDLVLVAHLRMTGRLIYYSNSRLPLALHTSARFLFEGGGELRFEDVRKFGTLNLVRRPDFSEVKGLVRLGVEPLSSQFTVAALQKMLQGRSVKIKSLLLDQSKIAGLGNIYADESLFQAGIHPERPAASLSEAEQKRLHGAIRSVLESAIEGQGTTLRDYRTGYGREGSFQNQLRIYGKKGEACPNCGTGVQFKKVGGRTSHFCPLCQKE